MKIVDLDESLQPLSSQCLEDWSFEAIDASEHAAVAEWGISDGLFVDGHEVRTAPPPRYVKVRSIVEKRVRRL